MKKPLFLLCVLTQGLPVAYAHTVRNRASSYSDNGGSSVQRYKVDLGLELSHRNPVVSQTSYMLSASQEKFTKDDISEDEYMQKYHGEERVTDAVNLTTNQTWNRITDTRVMGGYTSDGVMHSRTGGAGLSHWFWHENLQLSADVSRTVVEQPLRETVGADSDAVAPPTMITSTGASISSKYLATPTTVSTLSYTHVEKNDRPPANIYVGGLKQYIKPTKSAVHAEVARAFNQGRVTNKTEYGEVNAWIAEVAFLQTLWRGANTKLSYRYYKEDETTRVDKDEFVRGSDLLTFFFAQEFTKNIIDSLAFPLVLEASAARYKTNELEKGNAVAANIFEVGLSAKF